MSKVRSPYTIVRKAVRPLEKEIKEKDREIARLKRAIRHWSKLGTKVLQHRHLLLDHKRVSKKKAAQLMRQYDLAQARLIALGEE